MLSDFRAELDGVAGVRNIRGKAPMIGIELERNCTEWVAHALEQGLLINVTAGKVVRLLSPLIISDAEAGIIEQAVRLLREFAVQ